VTFSADALSVESYNIVNMCNILLRNFKLSCSHRVLHVYHIVFRTAYLRFPGTINLSDSSLLTISREKLRAHIVICRLSRLKCDTRTLLMRQDVCLMRRSVVSMIDDTSAYSCAGQRRNQVFCRQVHLACSQAPEYMFDEQVCTQGPDSLLTKLHVLSAHFTMLAIPR
jgi:hypothetical protein